METNTPLICPSLKPLICNLLKSGRHVTRPNQGLFSLAPGGGKMRDPGNEVAFSSCFEPHNESEAKCKVFFMEVTFHSNANKTNFHMKSFAQHI